MYLKALELYGFKSFPDRTRLDFGGGLTAVVGPNGSGKSNISDAVRWVLGEQSAKQLRGAKMQSVIFGGTQLRSAMGFAQVSLIIDNSDHSLSGIDAEEVVVTRKLYRSGESEYRIGGNVVRLKDVWELFMDTGLGKDGYSIISQGKIGEVVSAKSGERREIFEEAAGISKHRYKKNEAQRKLDAAQENLLRLYDIVSEMESHLEPLRVQSEKAVKFLELDGTRKNLEISLWSETLRLHKQSLREHQDKLMLAQNDLDRINAQIEQVETESEAHFTAMGKMTIAIQRCNDDIAALTEQIGQQESAVLLLQNDQKHMLDDVQRLRHEQEQVSDFEGSIDEKIAAKETEIGRIEQLIGLKNEREQQVTAQLSDLISSNFALEDQSRKLTDKLAAVAAYRSENRVELFHLNENITRYRATVEDSTQKFELVEENLAKAKKERRAAKDLLEITLDKLQSAKNTKDGYGMKVQSRKDNYDRKKAALDELVGKISSGKERYRLLNDLKNNMEGFGSSVKVVTQAGEQGKLYGILGPVAAALSVDSKYAVAIETALGMAAQNIIVKDESAAKAAINFLKVNRAGRATFLPLTTIKPRKMTENLTGLDGFVGVAADLVGFDNSLYNIIYNLLGNVAICEDMDSASVIAKKFGYRFRIVTLDGQIINAGGSYTGGQATNRSAGVFSRQNELEKLKVDLAKQQEQAQTLNEECKKLYAELANINAIMEGAESEIITFTQDKIRAEGELARLNQYFETCSQQYDTLADDIDRFEKLLKEAQKRAGEVQKKDDACASEQDQLNMQLSSHSEEASEYNTRRQQLQDEISALKMEVMSLEKDILVCKDDIIALTGSKSDSKTRYIELSEEIENRLARVKEIDTEAAQIKEAVEGIRAQIGEKREQIETVKASQSELEIKRAQNNRTISELRDTRESVGNNIVRLEERKSTLEAEFDKILADLFEQHGLTREQAESIAAPIEDIGEVKRELTSVRNRIRALGSVNVDSIEEYKALSERHEQMTAQIKDVEDSKAKLTRLIGELTREMITLFGDAFNQINHHFGIIFTDLFGGGSAKLVLTDPENVLESGIEIIVSPPGKLIKDLQQLSGGEQALVAISIYFAILKVKPSPFCILDEIEAALDDVNVTKFAQYLRSVCDDTQFITITHRRGTMEEADTLYGVTMQEEGVSKLLKLDVSEVGSQYK